MCCPHGNAGLLPFLQAITDIFDLYVSKVSGDDATGNGTFLYPFKTIQRALDEIPTHASGVVYIHLIGVGNYSEYEARNYLSPKCLTVVIEGDTSITLGMWTLGTGTQVPNPDGGVRFFQWDYDVGSYGATFSNASAWLEVTPQGGPLQGLLMDGANSSSPNIRVCVTANQAPDGLTVSAHPFTTIIESDVVDFSHACIVKAVYSPNQRINVVGCILAPNIGITNVNCNLFACLSPASYLDESWTNMTISHFQGEAIFNHGSGNSYFNQPIIGGIFEGGAFNADGLVNILSRAAYMVGVYRCSESSGNKPIVLGAHSGGNPGPGCGVEMDFCDFEMPSAGQSPVLLVHGTLRVCNDGGVSLSNVGTFLKATKNSNAEVNAAVYGATSLPCVEIHDQSTVEGLASFNSGDSDLMHNGTDIGQDVIVGTVTVAFGNLPETDLDDLSAGR